MKESGEMYLETIYFLSDGGKNPVKSVDVANKLGISRPSVNHAVSVLKQLGYIRQEAYGDITVTEAGLQYAAQVVYKHRTITEFLVRSLNLPADTAEADACRIEHVVSNETIERMAEYVRRHGG